jgi:antitoxin HicB
MPRISSQIDWDRQMTNRIDYYMSLPYTIELQHEPEGGWFVRVKELRGCMSQGDTAEEAVVMIQEAMELWLEVALEDGAPIPEPRPLEDYSGRFVVRVPRSLHRELVESATREGVSLNQYINVALAKAVAQPLPMGRLAGPVPGDAAHDSVPFRRQVPGGQWTQAASTIQEESGTYSVGEEEADDSRDAEQTQDAGE